MDDKVKELLEKIRGTATVAADTAVDTARIAGRKAGQMMDVAKLNVQLFDLNGEFDATLRSLGKIVYDTHLGQSSKDEVSDLLAQADETAEKIAQVKARAALLRQSKICHSCAAACSSEDQFCRHCGSRL